jgi:hypothetical protein
MLLLGMPLIQYGGGGGLVRLSEVVIITGRGRPLRTTDVSFELEHELGKKWCPGEVRISNMVSFSYIRQRRPWARWRGSAESAVNANLRGYSQRRHN